LNTQRENFIGRSSTDTTLLSTNDKAKPDQSVMDNSEMMFLAPENPRSWQSPKEPREGCGILWKSIPNAISAAYPSE
jgi:hypothetical protein